MLSRETPTSHRGVGVGVGGIDSQRRRRLLMGVPEVALAPLLSLPSSSYSSSSSFSFSFVESHDQDISSPRPVVSRAWKQIKSFSLMAAATSIFRSFLPAIQSMLAPACHWLTVPPAIASSTSMQRRRKMTGTFFGTKRGRVCFAVQEDPRSEPVLLLDLAIPTSHLVKEMASGMVRILLECERGAADADSNGGAAGVGVGGKKNRRHLPRRPLWEEPLWTVYCNGHKRGYAVSRRCGEADFTVLRAVQAVSVGAGVLPLRPALPSTLERKESSKGDECLMNGGGGGEVMYMRARFERVVGGRDSEAFYMISPDGGRVGSLNKGAPELSIFLLRM